MSEGSTSADASSTKTSTRREERWADAVQPEAVEHPTQMASQRWIANIKATQPAGGKNKGRKDSGLSACRAATKEAAEAARDKKLHAWLHAPKRAAPEKRQKVDDDSSPIGATSTTDTNTTPVPAPVPARPKRGAKPDVEASFKQPRVQGGDSTHRTAGPGCAQPVLTRCVHAACVQPCSSAHIAPRIAAHAARDRPLSASSTIPSPRAGQARPHQGG